MLATPPPRPSAAVVQIKLVHPADDLRGAVTPPRSTTPQKVGPSEPFTATLEPKYTKLKVLGEGSFGVVYLVKETNSGSGSRGRSISPSTLAKTTRSVSSHTRGAPSLMIHRTPTALDGSRLFVAKELRLAAKTKGASTAAMVMKEVNVLAKLNHPNIVQYIEHIQEPDKAYIIMEYCDGGDLKGFLKERQAKGLHLTEKEIVSIMSQLLSAVEYIHTQHLIHRDIKSANIFMTKKGKVKLGDFGLTKEAAATAAAAHTICGTPMYYSPELCVRAKYDAKTDVWALGCILWELMNLYHPYRDMSVKQVLDKIRVLEYPDPNPGGRYSRELGYAVTQYMMCPLSSRLSASQLRMLPIFGGPGFGGGAEGGKPTIAPRTALQQQQSASPLRTQSTRTGPYDAAAAAKILELLDRSTEDPTLVQTARDALNGARGLSFQDRCGAAETVVRALGGLATQDVFMQACTAMGVGSVR